MSEQEFKYPVDISKIKSNKLYSKFVKSLEKESTKPKEEHQAKPIEYHTAYQNRPQVNERPTLVRPTYNHASGASIEENASSFNSQLDRKTKLQEYGAEYADLPSKGSPQLQTSFIEAGLKTAGEPSTTREGRRGGTFRAEFANKEFERQPQARIPTSPPQSIGLVVEEVATTKISQHISHPTATTVDSEKLAQQYKMKFEKLSQAFEEFKKTSIDENRQKKTELIGYQETIEIMKEKMYDVQSREDELILENQRLKQKMNSETVLRTRLEQQNKELDYKIQELSDMLESRQAALRKKSDEAAHWKTQADNLKGEIHNLKLSNERLALSLSEYEEEQQCLKREKQNKDTLHVDLKEKVALLIRENARLKDEIHFMSMKLSDIENENFLLRTDIKRENNLTQVLSSHGEPPQARNEPQQTREPRRRGEFTREREKANETRENQRISGNMPIHTPLNNSSQVDLRKQSNADRQLSELMQQQKTLETELEKLRDLKTMSGAMRKRKIDMERQLEQIQNKLTELRGEHK